MVNAKFKTVDDIAVSNIEIVFDVQTLAIIWYNTILLKCWKIQNLAIKSGY